MQMMIRGGLATALCALIVALATCGPVATTARTAPESGDLGVNAGMGASGQMIDSILAVDGTLQDDFQTGRALLATPYVSCHQLCAHHTYMHLNAQCL